MRRAKHAAMLLTIAAGLGWSGPASDARASRVDTATALAPMLALDATPDVSTLGPRVDANVAIGDGEWRYVATRR